VKLIFLHGPAASGKHTIGAELARLTGLPLFHNHLIVDAVGAVFEFGTEPFVDLREQFWTALFDRAASDGQSLIFTFQPEATVSEDFPDRTVDTVEAHGGEVSFIQLICPDESIFERLNNNSRQSFGKLRDIDLYRKLDSQGAFDYPPLPHPRLVLDTSTIDPDAAAARIAAVVTASSPIAG
jgi:hypothetical protein